MIKLMPIVEQLHQEQLDELGMKDIALGAAMAASSIFGGAKAQSKIPTQQPAITQQASTVKTNPNFWVKPVTGDVNPDIQKIQTVIKAFRYYTLGQWKKDNAVIMGTWYNDLTPAQAKDIESKYITDATRTDEDGKNGEFTSKFIFPKAFLIDLNTGKIKDLGIDGNTALTLVAKSGLNIQQMEEWNKFVKWMADQGVSGDEKMDHAPFRNKILVTYKLP